MVVLQHSKQNRYPCMHPAQTKHAEDNVSRLMDLWLQALIDGQVLCVHGGLSPDLRTLDQVCSVCMSCHVCCVMSCEQPAHQRGLNDYHLSDFILMCWENALHAPGAASG